MFPSSHICASCLRTISRRRIPGFIVQSWQSKAGFVSLESNRTEIDVDSSNKIILTPESERNKKGKKPRRIPRTRLKRKEAHSTILEELFEESAQVPGLSNEIKKETQGGAHKASLEAYAKDEKLETMLKDHERPLAEIWEFFVSELGPQTWNSGRVHIIQPIRFKFHTKELYKKLISAKAHEPLDKTLPSMSQVVHIYDQLGFLTISELRQALTQLLTALKTPMSSSEREGCLKDLLELWQIAQTFLHRPFGRMNNRDTQPATVSPLSMHQNQWNRSKWKGGVEDLFRVLLPAPQAYMKSIAALAVMTFAFATDNSSSPNLNTNSFVLSVAEHLSGSHVTYSELHHLLSAEEFTTRFPTVGVDSILKSAHQIAKILRVEPLNAPSGKSYRSRYVLHLYQRLVQAQNEKDVRSLDLLWDELQHEIKEESNKTVEVDSGTPLESGKVKEKPPVMSEKLFNRFMHAYMILGQPDKALTVWNVMIENSIFPTIMTWNTLLEGYGMTRQWSALETVWARCLASGQQPDVQLWTTRINGLMECGHDRRAVQALKDMRTFWETAAKRRGVKDFGSAGDIDGVVKPNTSTINAVLSGLLRHGKENSAQDVLAWGDEIGIKPDIYTFNILLRSLVRQNKLDGIVLLLKQMQKQKVDPDAATFTTILDEFFKDKTSYSHEEQTEMVNSIFDEMAAAGIQANEWTYSKTIHSLLRHSNTTAVKSLLERMAAQRVQPSPHLYTALVDWYFAQTPPNLDGVGRLLERAKHSGRKLDHVFWNQVVDGYARACDTANALIYLRKVDMDATWSTLEAVLIALVKNDESHMAKELMKNTRERKAGPPTEGEHSTEGQRMFWDTVAGLKLDEEINSH